MERASTAKPVREIGVKHRSVRGNVPKMGRYESTLERDLMELIRFDPTVCSFLAQPLTIEYLNKEGERRTFTPDGLVHFKPESHMAPLLYEVKHREDFRKGWKILLPKFRAAKAFCAEKGWRFQVFTEREIRTPYLTNIKFLWPFLSRVPCPIAADGLLHALGNIQSSDPQKISDALPKDASSRVELLPVLWHLIAIRAIGCDLEKPLSMVSKIWALEKT